MSDPSVLSLSAIYFYSLLCFLTLARLFLCTLLRTLSWIRLVDDKWLYQLEMKLLFMSVIAMIIKGQGDQDLVIGRIP